MSAVDLFFVLSSFLITTMILRYREEPGFLRTFYTRRFLRIWPPYYVALGTCLILTQFFLWDNQTDAWPWYATFTQNVQLYFRQPLPEMSKLFWHTWTLAIEEQFYVIWPLLLLGAGRPRVVLTAVVFILLPPVLRHLNFLQYLLFTRSDGLGLGAILALLLLDHERFQRHIVSYRIGFLALATLAILWSSKASVVAGVPQTFFHTRVNLIYFSLVGLLVSGQGSRALAILRDKRLCYLGTISYALYVYHPLIFGSMFRPYRKLVIRGLGFDVKWVEEAVMLALCFLAAELSRRFLEAPILAFKEKLAYRAPREP